MEKIEINTSEGKYMDSLWMIQHRKSVNKRIKEARNRSKPVKCPICNRQLGKTCNSHSIPQMVLKTIETNGHFYNKNIVDNMMFFDSETGTNNTGTFHYICNSCDNTYFSDYENPEAIHAVPNNRVLIEIAVKDMLQKMQQKAFEIALYKYDILLRKNNIVRDLEDAIRVLELDFRDYNECIDKLKKEKEENAGDFKIIYRTVLPYITPIAMQECFTIYRDRLGKKINDLNIGEGERVQVVHMCVFPHNENTTVLMFYDAADTSYDSLYEQFANSTEEENLKYVNYYMLALGENYFYSEKISKTILQDKSLKKISQEYIGERGNFGVMTATTRSDLYTPVEYDEIPFLLGREYAL